MDSPIPRHIRLTSHPGAGDQRTPLTWGAATPELLKHRGPAVVFHGYDDMRRRVDDPDFCCSRDDRGRVFA